MVAMRVAGGRRRAGVLPHLRPCLLLALAVGAAHVVLLQPASHTSKRSAAAAVQGERGGVQDTGPASLGAWEQAPTGGGAILTSRCMQRVTERCVCVDHGPRDACIRHGAAQCGWTPRTPHAHPSVHLQLPDELRLPGELSAREGLSESSLCFLWYTGSLYSRATGSAVLQRQGGPVDDKALLAKHVRLYEARHRCAPHSVLPESVDLRDPENVRCLSHCTLPVTH